MLGGRAAHRWRGRGAGTGGVDPFTWTSLTMGGREVGRVAGVPFKVLVLGTAREYSGLVAPITSVGASRKDERDERGHNWKVGNGIEGSRETGV